MSLRLPQELAVPLAWTGLVVWPDSDEDAIRAEGTRYVMLAARLRRSAQDMEAHQRQVWERNSGDGVDAYRSWAERSAPVDRANRLADALELVGMALLTAALIVLLWKLGVIAQLVALLIAVARAAATAVVSPAASPAAVAARTAMTRVALRRLLDDVVRFFSRGVVDPLKRAVMLLRGGAGRLRGRPANWDPLRVAANRDVDLSAIRPRPGFRDSPFRGTRPVWRRDDRPLYRSDTRHPDEIFSQGLQPRNPANTDLNGYVAFLDERARSSAFVGTSYNRDIHRWWHEYGRQGWVYEVSTPGGTGIRLPGSSYDEVVFPGGVAPDHITRARPYRMSRQGEMTVGDWLENPRVRPD
ncbi:WXG100 family type VII secretion target [Streptosporangium sp. NPDC050855]|uniref:WXG100 family type VII secretion target n=1 Tax=Streptosporangium sp. NPDC050855 TaxID=3366194 RepID=UPI0037953441